MRLYLKSYNNIKMGNNNSTRKNSPNQSSNSQNEGYFDEITQYDECCGFQRKRIVRNGLIWEQNFTKNCQDLNMYYQWIHDVEEAVKIYGRKLPRKKFIDEYNQLRIINKIQPLRQDQILLSPSQIDEFKVNLKSSVLLSYGQAIKTSRPKQSSRIQSVMVSSTSKKPTKNINLSSSFNGSPLRSSRKRSECAPDQLRKQSILRQRQRTLRQQSFSKSGFRDSILSFVDDTMSAMFRGHQKQISKQSAHALQVFIRFSLMIEKHLTSQQNIMSVVIDTFKNYIYKKYPIFNNSSEPKKQNQIEQITELDKQALHLQQIQQKWKNKVKKQRFKQLQDRKNLSSEDIEDLTNDIKIFLVLLKQMVQDYYKVAQFSYIPNPANESLKQQIIDHNETILNPNFNTNNLITNQDNILILVTTALFKNQKFYNHIVSLFKKYNEEREKNFKKILQELAGRPPQYFQVKKQYCLNDCTLEKYQSDVQVESKVEQDKTQKQQQKQNQQTIQKSTISEIKYSPYVNCAKVLQKLSKSKSPTSKMKTIMQCSQKITESVAQFYNTNKLQLKNQVLDADQVLSIFCYILSTSELENVHSNLFMIEHFATENQMISVTGYYYSVLTIAVEQLENMYSSTVADMESMNKSSSYTTSKAYSVKSSPKKRSKSGGKGTKMGKDKVKRSFKTVEP